jgi:subtilisin-like proprotein convertase family protein
VTAGAWTLNMASTTPSSGTLGAFTDGTLYNVTATLSDAAGNSQSDATTNEVTMDHLTALTLSVTGYSSATPLVINIGGSTRSFSANGTSVVTLNYNAAYTFAVTTQPTGQACTFPASAASPRTSISGTAGANATISVVCQSTNMTFTNSTALTVPVNTSSTPITLTSTLTVANNVQISDLNLYVNMTHSWMSDVSIRLTSPSGTNVLLMERPGSTSALNTVSAFTHAGCNYNNMSATLDDEAASTVESSCLNATPAVSGTRRPNNPLSAFDGVSTAGVWTLTIYDSHPRADGGSLTSWSMNVTTSGL